MNMRMIGAATCAVALGIFFAGQALAEPLKLTVVHFNDIDRMEDQKGLGGLAKLATIVKRERAENRNVLVTHGGDTISPSLLAGIDKGAHMIDLLNKLEIDVMALGNHEYDFGPDVAKQRIKESKFPNLSANSMDVDGKIIAGAKANVMWEFDGWKIGMFGLTTPTTAVRASPAPVVFADVLTTADEQVKQLRERGADFVFALAHTTVSEDEDLIAQGAADFILGGDDHDLRIKWFGKTGFVESLSQADYVTVIDFLIDKTDKGKVVWHADYDVINTFDVEPDPEMAAHVKVYTDKLDQELGVVIGKTATELDTRRVSVRGGETAFGNLVADAMREAVKADVAITNGGGIRADRTYAAGSELTRKDIQKELPFGNTTVLIELSGADLLAALENGFSKVEDTDGRFPQVSGMTITADITKPAGQRVVAAKVGGTDLDPGKSYRLATNDFMARGGDGYGAFKNGKTLIDATSGAYMASQVMDYIEANGTVSPKIEGRITLKR